VALVEVESFECVLEWIACSYIEFVSVQCLGVLNGGGWGCIYSHQSLSSHCPVFANHERSVPLVRTVRPCISTVEITTVSSNSYINGYSALNASSDVRHNSSGRSGRAPRTVRKDAKYKFYRTRHLQVFLAFQRPESPSLVPDGALFSFGQPAV
jgi:hypothetical protein